MLWLSLLISLAFVPGWTGASIPTGWAAMSLTLPLATWKRVTMTPIHWLGLAFLAYAFASLAWAPRSDDAINEIWHLTLFAFAFVLGAQLSDLRRFWIGLAVGCGVSSVLALVQWWGGASWQILPTSNWAKPPGLFFNDAVAGAFAAIVFVGCIAQRSWWALAALPLLALSQSRGAWLAAIATYAIVIWNQLSWRDRVGYALVWTIPIAVAILYYHTGSDPIRLVIWKQMWQHLTLAGSGAGSSQAIYLFTPTNIFHIEHAHNDYIQLAYEYGLGAIPLLVALALLLEHRNEINYPPLVCCTVLSLYFWTLEAPVTGFAFAVVAGRVAADLGVAWDHGYSWGLAKLLRRLASQSSAGAGRRKDVPVQLGSTAEAAGK